MGRKRKLTAVEQAKIWALYQDKIKVSDIAKEVNQPYALVYACIKRELNELNAQTKQA